MIRYRDIGERADRMMAGFAFFVGFNLMLAMLLLASVDVANFYISIITAEAVLLAVPVARAAWAGVHAKLDEILLATSGARDELAHAEDRDEAEIAELRS